MKWIAGLILRLLGWRMVGTIPEIDKGAIIGAYHTSNWDGILMLVAAPLLPKKIYWLGKHTLFTFPLSLITKPLGGIALDRQASRDMVGTAVREFEQRDSFFLVLSPEGTRKKVTRWKRGFYVIAERAQVPIILASMNYEKKEIEIGPHFLPSGDVEADLQLMRDFYADKTPRHPERATPPIFAPMRGGSGASQAEDGE